MIDDRLPTVTLSSGTVVPALGLGTWQMGEVPRRQAQEIDALRAVTAPGPKQAWLDALDAWGRDVARSLA